MANSSLQVSSNSSLERHPSAGEQPASGGRKDKRHPGPRSVCAGAVRLSWTSGFDRYAIGECQDISQTGLRLLVPEPLPVSVRVCFWSDRLAFGGSGTVRHCKRQNGKYIIGLEFGGGLRWLGAGPHSR